MPPKLAYLDALRGLAAIIVVAAHSVGAFYPHAIFGEAYAATSSVELWLRVPPLSLAIAGHAAVCLFFILSGYVLSLSFLTRPTRRGQLTEAMLKRPVRLGGLVVSTILVGYLLMWSESLITPASGATAPWLANFWQTRPRVDQFVLDLVFQPFASGTIYNPPLWTIHKELVGSYLVFGYLALSQRLGPRGRWALLGLMALLTFRSLYVGFVLGLAFAQAQTCSGAARRLHPGWTWALLLAGLGLTCQMHYLRADADIVARSSVLVKLAADFGTGGSAMAGALLIFAAVWLDERFQRALDNPVLRFLGSLSFAIYALHFLVLGSVTWHAYQAFLPSLGHHAAAAAATAGSYALLIALAIAATRWIDLPSTKLASLLARWLYAKGHAWLSSLAARTRPVLNRQKTRQQKEPALSGFPDVQRDPPVAPVEHQF